MQKMWAIYACLILFSLICLTLSILAFILIFNLSKIKANLKQVQFQSDELYLQVLKAQKEMPNEITIDWTKILLDSGLLVKLLEIALLFSGGGFTKAKILKVFLNK